MASADLGLGEQLTVEPQRHLLDLQPAIGGVRLQLRFTVAAVSPTPTISALPFSFAADLYASRQRSQGERMVCHLMGEYLVTPTARGSALTLTGFVSAEQVHELEDVRAGEHLSLHLVMAASSAVDGQQRQFRIDEYITLTAGEWGPELERIEQAAFVELLVPMPTAPEFATATRRLREARGLLRSNDVAASMGAARLALEAVREELDTMKVAAAANAIKAKERNQVQRHAVMVEAAYSQLCGAMHDDEITKAFRYTRTQAATLIAFVAGAVRDLSESL